MVKEKLLIIFVVALFAVNVLGNESVGGKSVNGTVSISSVKSENGTISSTNSASRNKEIYNELKGALDLLVKLHPNDTSRYQDRAESLLKRNVDLKDALWAYREWDKVDPKNLEVKQKIIEILEKLLQNCLGSKEKGAKQDQIGTEMGKSINGTSIQSTVKTTTSPSNFVRKGKKQLNQSG